MGSFSWIIMRTAALLSVCLTSVSAQGFLNGLSNLLTSAVGGGPVGEVEGYENAPYQVVNSYDGYEERYYPSNMWVCTRSGGFMNLFRYISGDNSRDQKIDMTVPVMMTHDEKGQEMCFYLSNKRAMYGYATTMGGYPNMENEARKLKAVLERGRASQVDFSSYIAMSYDNPWKIMNRRNDVMYKKL